MKTTLLLLLLAVSTFTFAQTADVPPLVTKNLQYQYVSGLMFVDDPSFIQFNGYTCKSITQWIREVYGALPTATNHTQPKFSLNATCDDGVVRFDLIETGYVIWGGYGRTAAPYFHVEKGSIVEMVY